jgi:NAD(P)H-nitrite reductase large subunit
MLLLRYSLNKNQMRPRKEQSKIVCECLGVSESRLVGAIRAEGLDTLKEVVACTDAGGGCTVCHPAIREYLARERARAGRGVQAPAESYAAASASPSFSAR